MRIRIRRRRRSVLLGAALVCVFLVLPVRNSYAASASASPPASNTASVNLAASSSLDNRGETSSESSLSVTEATSTYPSSSVNDKSILVQLAGYVKDSLAKTADGCGQLWTNHGKCNDIRKKVNIHRERVKLAWEEESGASLTPYQKDRLKNLMGGISYEEYVFLQRGKEDRSKVFNLLFLMWGAPRFLPYALMFNPEMLPSSFRDTSTGEALWTALSRGRSTAVVQALLNLEQNAHRAAPAWSRLNVFSRSKPDEAKVQLLNVIQQVSDALGSGLRPPAGGEQLLSSFRPYLYRDGSDFTRAERRLCHVPKPLVQGVNGILNGGSGGGILASLQPHFVTRGRVVGHIRKVAESDDFLVTNSMNLTTIPKRFLQEACSERLMGVLGLSAGELRQQLADWLALTMPSADSGEFYNDNVARLALMGYYSCWAARDGQSALQLPPLLYKVPPKAVVAASKPTFALPPVPTGDERNGVNDSRNHFSSALKRPLQRFLQKR
jgi:hypothetical protein